MAYPDRNNKFGGGNGGKKFGGKGFGGGRSFGDRDSGRPTMMHKANCADCGNECEVPFKPMAGRPVFCSNCFKTKGDSHNSHSDGGNFGKPRFADKQTFEATCATCGAKCDVPFRPAQGKPVYCKQCFHKGANAPMTPTSTENYREQFAALNAKLDKILQALTPAMSTSAPAKEKVEKKIEAPKAKKEIKKSVTKKKK